MASSYDAQTIRAALDHAEIPALLPALAYLTGDLRLLPDELRPDPSQFMDPNGGISGDKLETARQLAFDALQRFLASGSQKASPPDPASLQKMLEFLVGGEAMEEYLPLFMEELAVDEEDMRAPGWKIEEYPSYQNFRVGIIGAGMSGLAAAHRLDQAGIDYLIFDKNPEVGGTWLENAYPGCRVDVPNFLY
ncbi:MAG: NAD(P)-binding protein, partial [Actinobacteria bacterium]|nr:NAD(P)-binding protein [Actinomycetota bacterium]